MYRCKDCGKEYKEKVEYCDCGNNTFDYIEEFVPAPKSVKQSKPQKQPLSVEKKSQIVSWIFFVACFVLSLIVWFMPVKVEQTIIEEIEEQKIDTKSIPNLEKIWNSAPPKVETARKTEEKSQNILDVIREDIPDKVVPKPIEVKKPVQNTQVNKPLQKPVSNNNSKTQNTSKNKPVTQTQNKPAQSAVQNKPVTQNKPVQQQNKQSSQQTQNKQTSNPNNLKPAQNQQTKNSAQNINKQTEKPKPVYNPNSLEMLKYKGSLRSALFAKLPIGSIQGSGSCSVQFAVDNTGKLINRGFSKQSDNKSLNDAVYYMLMSVPRFATPPDGYNQELIRMNIVINSDKSYEISIY